MNIFEEIKLLLAYGLKNDLIGKYDEIIARNEIIALLNLEEWKDTDISSKIIPEYPNEILENICNWAVENKIIEDTIAVRDLFDTKIMGKITPSATHVIDKFIKISNLGGIEKATNNYYEFAQKTNYIRTDRIAKNMHWYSNTEYGNMEITINLSKPEKDPRDIAKERLLPPSSYPKCLLCYENVGYTGRLNHPARQNHRVLPFFLEGEEWFLQYSPYVYYNEHAIVFSGKHRPMKINREAFNRITSFVEQVPHYFVGSNADLPIVGGSILSHDHYQGGHHEFPMAKSPIERAITFKGFEDVEAGIVKWPMSVIRIKSSDRKKLVDLSVKILDNWRKYNDESLDIIAFSGDTPHNTITPIGRRRGKDFELDLVLRNNRTNEKYPLGIFHPHGDVHNIKKENIGLIEVMGLAVLPGRLKEELEILKKYMLEPDFKTKIKNDPKVVKHLEWAINIQEKHVKITSENIKTILKDEIGVTFSRVLEDAGVYKRNNEGEKGLLRFIEYINMN
ncbi:UDP-glucose--hexose-1-phosphate uridylyltransferase [Fusobacterium varium]|jgi:UDPglucose--hexose-1-phosphate uridylyltransferase|uniref:Galactose-1-phosphate uridylyltransferase n=1 Tax=Fusobacterium varium ATCC 27725 TaxID=469618 RepID=A0ABN5JED8_FUSVA|nr:UDP-glucose--hexose-1-phosphate uridylyltransferase [Fusobacterium varium]AVQ30132.1 UDP-glucose--hexose-1-phosphate uridylyltransferase [Fusobacterium varium ATCC 27725]EES64844.1 UTP--hexose-1-phosphate uridylyltransferase [Fusobacterium varium ATCC 27725]VEH37947.1 galactose-1-phosphate uridylyltransferase [Fusobacterium varium]